MRDNAKKYIERETPKARNRREINLQNRRKKAPRAAYREIN